MQEKLKTNNDTIVLNAQDFEVSMSNKDVLDIILSDTVIERIRKIQSPVLNIEIDGGYKIAKGNYLTSSATPTDCDFFFPLDDGNKVVLFKNKLSLRRIIQ